MCKKIVITALFFAIAAFVPGLTQGQITWPDPNQCDVTVGVTDASCMILPDGSGTPLSSCYAYGGALVDATITVVLRDIAGNAIGDFPFDYIRLNEFNAYPDLLWCDAAFVPANTHAPNYADMNTQNSGMTTFSKAYYGGGWWTGGTQIWVRTSPTTWEVIPAVLPIKFNSPDLDRPFPTGSHVVDLRDVAAFVMYYWGPPVYQADFNYDGDINLKDVIIFSQSLGASCP